MQIMPWGLTLNQTLLIVGVVILALVLLGILRFILNVGMMLIRMGCLAIVIIAAIAIAMSFINNMSVAAH